MEIKKVGVVGCGLMGSGIVQVCAQSGYQVVASEINDDLLNKGMASIGSRLTKDVDEGKLSAGLLVFFTPAFHKKIENFPAYRNNQYGKKPLPVISPPASNGMSGADSDIYLFLDYRVVLLLLAVIRDRHFYRDRKE